MKRYKRATYVSINHSLRGIFPAHALSGVLYHWANTKGVTVEIKFYEIYLMCPSNSYSQ